MLCCSQTPSPALTGYGRDPASRFASPGAKSAQRLACDDRHPNASERRPVSDTMQYVPGFGGWGRAAPSTLAARICCYRGKQIAPLPRRSESALGPKASLCAAFDRPSLALLDQNGDALSNVHRSLKHNLPRAEFCLLFSMMALMMRLFLRFLRFSDRADDHRPICPVENAPIIGPATGQGLRRASSHVPGHT